MVDGGLGLGWDLAQAKKTKPLYDQMQASLEHHRSSMATRKWLEDLVGAHGNLIASQSLGHLKGLPGYNPHPFWQTFFSGSGPPMVLVIAGWSLLFFDPRFAPDARMTVVTFDEIKGVKYNLGDGAVLIVHLRSGGKIKFRAIAGPHGAIPIVTIIRTLL